MADRASDGWEIASNTGSEWNPMPDNELEGLMVQVASGLRSEDDFRRALHAAEVVLPQHRDEEGERPVGAGDEVAMRVVEVRGLRALPAFTSVAQLEKTVPRTSYVRVPVAALQQMAPPGVGLVLNPEGDLTRLLDPLELQALPDAPAGTLQPRPSSRARRRTSPRWPSRSPSPCRSSRSSRAC